MLNRSLIPRRNSLTIRGMILNNFYLNLFRLSWVIINHSHLDTVVSPSPLRILTVQTALGSSLSQATYESQLTVHFIYS